MSDISLEELFREIPSRLKQHFGERLRGVLLYGSYARGEATADSDIDLMIVLEGPVNFGEDLDQIIHEIYPLQLQIDASIEAIPVEAAAFEAGEYAIYRHAREDGVFL